MKIEHGLVVRSKGRKVIKMTQCFFRMKAIKVIFLKSGIMMGFQTLLSEYGPQGKKLINRTQFKAKKCHLLTLPSVGDLGSTLAWGHYGPNLCIAQEQYLSVGR